VLALIGNPELVLSSTMLTLGPGACSRHATWDLSPYHDSGVTVLSGQPLIDEVGRQLCDRVGILERGRIARWTRRLACGTVSAASTGAFRPMAPLD